MLHHLRAILRCNLALKGFSLACGLKQGHTNTVCYTMVMCVNHLSPLRSNGTSCTAKQLACSMPEFAGIATMKRNCMYDKYTTCPVCFYQVKRVSFHFFSLCCRSGRYRAGGSDGRISWGLFDWKPCRTVPRPIQMRSSEESSHGHLSHDTCI